MTCSRPRDGCPCCGNLIVLGRNGVRGLPSKSISEGLKHRPRGFGDRTLAWKRPKCHAAVCYSPLTVLSHNPSKARGWAYVVIFGIRICALKECAGNHICELQASKAFVGLSKHLVRDQKIRDPAFGLEVHCRMPVLKVQVFEVGTHVIVVMALVLREDEGCWLNRYSTAFRIVLSKFRDPFD